MFIFLCQNSRLMNRSIISGSEARLQMKKGVDKLVDTVKITIGAKGRNVVITTPSGEPHITKDGVTVAKNIQLSNQVENAGAQIVKNAAINAAKLSGDGTSTTCVLTQALIEGGLKAIDNGASPLRVKQGIEYGIQKVVEYLKEKSSAVTVDTAEKIALVSSNGDETVSSLIGEAVRKVGLDGHISWEELNVGTKSKVEAVNGYHFDRGWNSPYFVNSFEKLETHFENPYILITEYKINSVNEILHILEFTRQQNRPLLLISDHLEADVVNNLAANVTDEEVKLKFCSVQAPEFDATRSGMLEDIALITGGTVISKFTGLTLKDVKENHLGTCKKVIVDKENTYLIDCVGNEELAKAKGHLLTEQASKVAEPYLADRLLLRAGKLLGGTAVIYVGASSDIERKEIKDRVEDAVYAVRSAIAEGVLPGGGTALFYARDLFKSLEIPEELVSGVNVVINALSAPMEAILGNADYSIAEVAKSLESKPFGYGMNVDTGKSEDLGESGILDPFKVTRVALESSASVATTFLMSEAVIFLEE